MDRHRPDRAPKPREAKDGALPGNSETPAVPPLEVQADPSEQAGTTRPLDSYLASVDISRSPDKLSAAKSPKPEEATDPESSGRFFARMGPVFREHGSTIPASFAGTLLALAIMRPVLGALPVKNFIESIGSIPGAGLCLGVMTCVWYPIYMHATDPAMKWCARRLERLLGRQSNKPAVTQAGKSLDSEQLGQVKRLEKRAFTQYLWAFNLGQFVAQAIMLHAGVEPKTAQTWNSLVGNILWLAPLPFVKDAFFRRAQRQAAAASQSTHDS